MEAVNQHANESKLKYKIPKGQPLHEVWNSLWEQCEEANEISNGFKMCLPRANKNVANIMKMMTVFHSEVKKRSSRSDSENKTDLTSDQDLCDCCGSSKSKQKLLEENYKRRGEIIEYLLSHLTAPLKMNERLKESSFEKSKGTRAHFVKGSPVTTDTETPEVADIPLNQSKAKGANNLVNSFTKEDREEEKLIGTSMLRFKPTLEHIEQLRGYRLERETPSKEDTTKTLVKLLGNFTKYDPSKEPFTNMFVFENECSQHNLGPRESCLIMKLWLPSKMSARLSAPVARPAGGPQFWSADYHWGDTLDRVKALTHLVTGEDHLGTDILEDLTVASEDDPWDFSKKFDQAFRLVMDVHEPNPPPALLKALVNKFNFVDRPTHVEASKEETIEGIARIVDSYQRNRELKAASLRKSEIKCIREVSARESIPKDEQPMRWRR